MRVLKPKNFCLDKLLNERQTFLDPRNSNGSFTDALGMFIFRTYIEASDVSLIAWRLRMKNAVVYVPVGFILQGSLHDLTLCGPMQILVAFSNGMC